MTAQRQALRRGGRGMVTVELAIGLIVVAILAVVAVGVVSLGAQQGAAASAASQIARQQARGDQDAAEEARKELPPGSSVEVNKDNSGVSVAVEVRAPVFKLGAVPLRAEAFAKWEPGEGP